MRNAIIVVFAIAAAAGTARASDYYGTLDAARLCEKETAAAKAAPDMWKWLDEAMKTGQLSPQCKAEMDKEMPACKSDRWMQRKLTDPEIHKGNPDRVCHQEIFGKMWEQIINDDNHKKEAAEEAKRKEEANAKAAAAVAATELPKPGKRDAKLEKAVADAYHRDYPEGKVLKVVLGSWSDDYEKDAFGRVTGRDLDATVVNQQPDGKCQLHNEYWMQHGNGRSFGGPLSARGAGSLNKQEILCSKVGADATGGGRKKR